MPSMQLILNKANFGKSMLLEQGTMILNLKVVRILSVH